MSFKDAGKDVSLNPGVAYLQQQGAAPVSPVRVCFTSKSSAGAWQIRGAQIAAMRSNWEAINKPSVADIKRFDVFCVVKRADWDFLEEVRKAGKAVVYDIVDAWPKPSTREAEGFLKDAKRAAKQKAFELLNPWDQPGEDDGSVNTPAAAREMFGQLWAPIKADAYIFPTETMRRDLGPAVNYGVTIYHHYWPQIKTNPLREKVLTIGHEGNAAFLGEWDAVIRRLCEGRGLNFVVNPAEYTDIDIVIVVRGGAHATFLTSSYKSNVKTANAYGSGTPVIVHNNEMSAHDTDEGDILFFTDEESLGRQMDKLIGDYQLRQLIQINFLKAAQKYRIERIADQYEALFADVINRKKNGIKYESAA
ncbi:MAG: glycosyltransferase [Bdellovibrionales bacterium]